MIVVDLRIDTPRHWRKTGFRFTCVIITLQYLAQS